MPIEYVKEKSDGSFTGGPFADGEFYLNFSKESPLWLEVEKWISEGNEIEPYSPPASTLEELRTAAALRIDTDAEAARLRYITGGSGQAMTYQQKAQEAAAAILDPAPDPDTYPLLKAEIGITAPTLAEVAAVVNDAYQAWRVVGAAIEALRLGGKAAVAAASTPEAIQSATEIAWP